MAQFKTANEAVIQFFFFQRIVQHENTQVHIQMGIVPVEVPRGSLIRGADIAFGNLLQ